MALYNHFIFPQDFEIPSTKQLNSREEKELTIRNWLIYPGSENTCFEK